MILVPMVLPGRAATKQGNECMKSRAGKLSIKKYRLASKNC